MTVKELRAIISSADVQTISNRLLERGFRIAYPNLIWKYKDLFSMKKNIIKNVCYKNTDRGFDYRARVYQDMKNYGEIIFIEVALSQKTLFYTNMPVDEEYEREQAIEGKCANCKETHIKKSLIEHGGGLLCAKCLYITLIKGFGHINIDE